MSQHASTQEKENTHDMGVFQGSGPDQHTERPRHDHTPALTALTVVGVTAIVSTLVGFIVHTTGISDIGYAIGAILTAAVAALITKHRP